jgi:hypothetical protein
MTVKRVPEDLDALIDGELPRPRKVAPLALLQEAVAEDLRPYGVLAPSHP